jgi:hypothetical protein
MRRAHEGHWPRDRRGAVTGCWPGGGSAAAARRCPLVAAGGGAGGTGPAGAGGTDRPPGDVRTTKPDRQGGEAGGAPGAAGRRTSGRVSRVGSESGGEVVRPGLGEPVQRTDLHQVEAVMGTPAHPPPAWSHGLGDPRARTALAPARLPPPRGPVILRRSLAEPTRPGAGAVGLVVDGPDQGLLGSCHDSTARSGSSTTRTHRPRFLSRFDRSEQQFYDKNRSPLADRRREPTRGRNHPPPWPAWVPPESRRRVPIPDDPRAGMARGGPEPARGEPHRDGPARGWSEAARERPRPGLRRGTAARHRRCGAAVASFAGCPTSG